MTSEKTNRGNVLVGVEGTASTGAPLLPSPLSEKCNIEAAMAALPDNRHLRTRYMEVLEKIADSHLGLFSANFPEVIAPLLFRGGSSDIWNLDQIFGIIKLDGGTFLQGEYGFQIPVPQKILDLGAYCGYTAVYFANRFPGAQIIAVEPLGANFDLLVANTAPYPNIRCLRAAVWRERTKVREGGRLKGDWGAFFLPEKELSSAPTVPAFTISDILEMFGWQGADLIKCTIQGGMVEVLAAPARPWLSGTTCITTKPVAVRWSLGEEAALLAAFPDNEFKVNHYGELLTFTRRTALDAPIAPQPSALPLIPPGAQRRPFALSNVVQFGFYSIDNTAIQLTPNRSGRPQATIVFRCSLSGHRGFTARIVGGKAESGSIRFKIRIQDTLSGSVVAESERTVPLEATFQWGIAFEPVYGEYDIILSTEWLAPDDPLSEPPLAFFIEPQLI